MLNGKFFTGLPPKMIERRESGGRNRMESHFFWPDDSKVDTAVESRVKRRNSIQVGNNERPLNEKQSPVADEVDTKKRFSREFSQSSIQFYDNLNENRSTPRRSLLRNSLGTKQGDITEKPTKTKLELPESVVDEAYTAAKKKQAYTSKIEFYDYDNDDDEDQRNNRNNLRKPKMDMNDKRDMELNTKNSPKLQVKRDVRNFSNEKVQSKKLNSDVRDFEGLNDSYDQQARERILNTENSYLQSRRSVPPRIDVSLRRGFTKTTNNYEQRNSNKRDTFGEPETKHYERQNREYHKHCEDMEDYDRDTASPELLDNNKFLARDYGKNYDSLPKRLERLNQQRRLQNNTKQYHEAAEYEDYSHIYEGEEEIGSRMRNVHLISNSQRKQHFLPKEYFDAKPKQNRYNNKNKTPTKPGSSHDCIEHSEREFNEIDLPYENNKTARRLNRKTSPINKIINSLQQKPLATASSPPPNKAESGSAAKTQNHLRSSLCFSDGEIVAKNDVTRSPTAQYPTQRRNARSSATQRVSVGLPD